MAETPESRARHLARLVRTARTLTELKNCLVEFEDFCSEQELDATRFVDHTSLPTFGGDLDDTRGVYSWDATHALVFNTAHAEHWEIIPRELGRM